MHGNEKPYGRLNPTGPRLMEVGSERAADARAHCVS